MWYLTSETDERIIYVVKQGDEVIIGRSTEAGVCSFPITSDASVSRKHASLTISSNHLILTDFGSTYGTFVNDFSNKIQANHQLKLKSNDLVRFGKLSNVWKVVESNLTTCTSTVKGENMQNLKVVLSKIGGILKNDWDNSCEYLTMPAITLTIKVVLALVQGSYIVTQDFWNKCLEAVQSNRPMPDPQNFTPEIVESTLNKETVSFLPDKRRKTLLKGKKIIFFSKRQFDMYKGVLTNCSGEPILIGDDVPTSTLCKKDVIVIQYNAIGTQDTQSLKDKIDEIVQYLKNNSKRVIADAEIGLAILYSSIDKYCNPDFNFSAEVMKAGPVQNNNSSKVLAPESQEPSMQANIRNVIINESLMSNDSSSAKRKLSADDDIETNVNKKQAIDKSKLESENVNKRKFIEDGNVGENSNPSKKFAGTGSSDDLFKFLEPTSKDIINKEKRLNLSKPQKRKADNDGNEDSLFNFLQDDKSNESGSAKHKMFDLDKTDEQFKTIKTENKHNDITPEQISAMRGSKLQELQQNNLNFSTDVMKKPIKKEYEELDNKMKELDLGVTIVTVNSDLIVKKEPVYFESIETIKSELKNFKKFKKVWPAWKQVTIIPNPTSSVVQDNGQINSVSYDSVEEI